MNPHHREPPFPLGHTETVSLPRPVPHPTLVHLTDGGIVTFGGADGIPFPTVHAVRLCIDRRDHHALPPHVLTSLVQALVCVPDVVLSADRLAHAPCCTIPTCEPDYVTDHLLLWHVTTGLFVRQFDTSAVTLSHGPEPEPRQGRPPWEVPLTTGDCWRLVRAVTSAQYWLRYLRTRPELTTTSLRRALRRACVARGVHAAAADRGCPQRLTHGK